MQMIGQICSNFNPQLLPQFLEGYPLVSALMVGGFVLHFLPTSWNGKAESLAGRTPLPVQAITLALMIFIVVQVKGSEVQPFIYFKF